MKSSFIGWLLSLSLTACATYQGKVRQARQLLSSGYPDKAAHLLKKEALKEGKDQLVYLFDYATALQVAKNYKESTKMFLMADQLADIKDYYSVSKIGTSLLFAEEMVQYKGEDYEKLLINVMLALNYLMTGELEEALVEIRRINEKLEYYKTEQKKQYEQNPFAIYLSALVWEENRHWDDAYIDFKKAYKLGLRNSYIEEDLLRAARKAQRWEDYRHWRKTFGHSEKKLSKDEGELIVIFQQGWAPRKYPYPRAPRYPFLYPVLSQTKRARVLVQNSDIQPETTRVFYSVEKVAIKTLNDAILKLVAKRLAGQVAKHAVAKEVRKKNEALGDLLFITMQLSDRADLRQWSTLPRTFQLAKLRLKAGTYSVQFEGLNDQGFPTGEQAIMPSVIIRPQHKTFVMWRSFR
ncbi:MAG: hypothetical protein D6797_05390 [Bdellovibrio sp.]|nr:MAG: hypothetical protein D6797_05390 [Bdellovibrio sp.]